MENEKIVIATHNLEKALFVIAKGAQHSDNITLTYTDNYAPTVDYLVRMLRKAFGWLETGTGTEEVVNTKCKYNQNNICIHSTDIKGRKCLEMIRANCDKYEIKNNFKMKVNTISIEKAGGIRGLN